MEEDLAVVAPGDDMVEGPGEFDSRFSSHVSTLGSNVQQVNMHA